MRAVAQIECNAPPEIVWRYVADPSRYLHFMSGITRWEVVSPKPQGLGARYKMLIRVGSAEIGGLIEVVESNPPRDLAWTSVTGIDQRGRWRLRELPNGRTRVELRLSAGVAGSGIFGWLSEQAAKPMVSGHLRRSLQQLKRQVEHEQLRERAAARRGERAATA
ncbi:MAG TPA: SRPBCC family protein [Solirubrobacteraceae bacterium]|nr:SRPBCC family protein [Solirubrobacteraceae bacterium]